MWLSAITLALGVPAGPISQEPSGVRTGSSWVLPLWSESVGSGLQDELGQ